MVITRRVPTKGRNETGYSLLLAVLLDAKSNNVFKLQTDCIKAEFSKCGVLTTQL